MFWEDPAVGLLSIHRWPFYPGTGDDDETGGGPGLGTTVNLPVEFGISRKDYVDMFRNAVERLAPKIRPQLILVSAGFDAHCRDPIGNLGLETEDFVTMTSIVLDIADVFAGGRVVGALEGGYDPDVIAECVAGLLREMVDRSEGGGVVDSG